MAHFTTVRKRRGRYFGGILILLIGVPLSIVGTVAFARAKATTSWPAVNGVVERSEVVEGRGRKGRHSYKARIDYSYVVEGRGYRGDRCTFLETSWSKPERAVQLQARYPVGATVDVFYDPQDPGRALLEPGVTTGNWALLVGGLVCLAFGFDTVIRLLKLFRAACIGTTIEEPASFPPRPVGGGPTRAPGGAPPRDGIHIT